MSGSLIDRVRERLATESAPLRPQLVADAIRAESGGRPGDTELLSNLRMLQTELTGAGILEPLRTVPTAPPTCWSPLPTRCGSTMGKVCGAPVFDSPMRPRCGDWRSGWH